MKERSEQLYFYFQHNYLVKCFHLHQGQPLNPAWDHKMCIHLQISKIPKAVLDDVHTVTKLRFSEKMPLKDGVINHTITLKVILFSDINALFLNFSPIVSPSESFQARDFSPRVNFQYRLSYVVWTHPCSIACINICAHVKDPVVNVRVQWIIETPKHPVCIVGWVSRLCRSWLSMGNATRMSHGRNSIGTIQL